MLHDYSLYVSLWNVWSGILRQEALSLKNQKILR